MKNGWSAERRAKQAAAIQGWKPWKRGGVKTDAGKAISKFNALRHGQRSAVVQALKALLRDIEEDDRARRISRPDHP